MNRALPMLAAVLLSCSPHRGEIRVGAKDFTEQRILATALAKIASLSGRAHVVDCGDSFSCQQMMRAGEIDLMVEYSGTAMLYSGAALGRRVDVDALRERLADLGLRWLAPLGFENGYRIVMMSSRATSLGVETIADLASHPRMLRFVLPRSYLSRPSDSYGALLARHGIEPRGPPLLVESTSRRLDAVLAGRADVAIAYGTDGDLDDLPLVVLEDSLGFFPAYDAAIVIREEIAKSSPELVAALLELEGTVDEATMRTLNYDVGSLGVSVEVAAERVLEPITRDRGEPKTTTSQRPALNIAVARTDDLDSSAKRALRMIRAAFGGRRLTIESFDDPVLALTRGNVRLAIVGAERFFRETGDRIAVVKGVEAIAVSGNRVLHFIRRRGHDDGPLEGRIGLGPRASGAARIGSRLLGLVGSKGAAFAEADVLIARVASGTIDGAILLAELGDPTIERAMADGAIELASLDDPAIRSRMPHLRPARIPPDTYSGQSDVLESLAAQVIIAGPAPERALRPGPTAALSRDAAQPLTLDEARTLSRAVNSIEAPDAALPSIWGRAELRPTARAASVAAMDTLLNLLAIAFLGWLVVLVLRRDTPGN